ncbi:class I SAM-dependent methyltransferase [Dapis sp. BLCC M126]|uniref:class I SAM-dependent methyltransferase n=1 Tax=Dapis sp. BLCC M126 TaxID=3400189 RepID=UPI003CEF8AA6
MTNTTTKNPGTSSEALHYHYDISNNFYQLWLDPSLTYSCALWEENEGYESHEIAQIRKLDFHINQARVKDAKRVLDIGCGWGSTLKRLADVYKVERAVGITLTKSHADAITAFKNPNIEVLLESWAEHSPAEPYDGIISLEAFEHFAKLNASEAEKLEGYRSFFSQCHSFLKPGGWISIQTIIYGNSTKEDFSKFCAEKVFPDSDLPRLWEIVKASEGLFEIVALRTDREHYVRTFKAWLKKLKENRQQAVDLVGEESVARYEKYCGLFMIGFHTGTMDLSRIAMRRIDKPRF